MRDMQRVKSLLRPCPVCGPVGLEWARAGGAAARQGRAAVQ